MSDISNGPTPANAAVTSPHRATADPRRWRAFIVGAAFAVLGVILALLFVDNSRPTAGDETIRTDAEGPLATASA
jgi:hypothetical protein